MPKNIYIVSGFQNNFQFFFDLHISICQSQFKNNTSIWETLYYRKTTKDIRITSVFVYYGEVSECGSTYYHKWMLGIAPNIVKVEAVSSEK